MTELRRSARHRALLAATLCASFLAAPHAQSFERVVVGARHYFECLGLLLSDPKAHAAECLPNNVAITSSSLSSTSSGSSFDFTTPPPEEEEPPVEPPVEEPPVEEPPEEPPVVVTPPPPPPPAPDPCACGSCYAQ